MSDPTLMQVLLGRAETTPANAIVAGSQTTVADCGCRVLISPSMRDQISAHKGSIHTTCIECSGQSTGDIIAGMNSGDIRLAKGGIDEINDKAGFNAVDLMRNRINIQEIE